MSMLETLIASPLGAGIVFLAGVALVIFSVEKFVEHVAAAAVGLGVSAFILTVILAGTDVENVVLGGAAVLGDLPDVGLGTVFGEAVFILCLALGLGGVIAPFEIRTPPSYLALTGLSPALLLLFSIDGRLSRLDGGLLVAAFVAAIWLLYRWERGRTARYLEPEGELESEIEHAGDGQPGRPLVRLGILVLALAGMTLGSGLAVQGTKGLLAYTGIAQLAFGATILSIVASLEEIFLTVEPARKGRPEIAAGNIIGSTVFFVTANAGVLALIRPLEVSSVVWTVHYPFLIAALGVVLLILYRGIVSRPIGVMLIGLYAIYWVVNYST